MQTTFPTPSDVVCGLRLKYADAYDSGPHDSLFSLLVHSNGQLAGVACLPTHVGDERLKACALEARHRRRGTTSVLVAVCDDPEPVLSRAADFYVPSPHMLIGVDSLQASYWHDYATGTHGRVDRSGTSAAARFLGHWDFCAFSETFSRNNWSYSKPTRFKSIDTPLERFVRSVASGRISYGYDHSRTGGVLVYSEQSRDEAIRAIDVNPANALAIFTAGARYLSGQARIEAVVAAGIAAFFAGKRAIAEHAYLIAATESAEESPLFGERMLDALGVLVSGEVEATSATELVRQFPPVIHNAGPVEQSA